MQTHTNNSNDILETMFHEFNEQYFYGLEYIMDEFYDKKVDSESSDNVDWFGLTTP